MLGQLHTIWKKANRSTSHIICKSNLQKDWHSNEKKKKKETKQVFESMNKSLFNLHVGKALLILKFRGNKRKKNKCDYDFYKFCRKKATYIQKSKN